MLSNSVECAHHWVCQTMHGCTSRWQSMRVRVVEVSFPSHVAYRGSHVVSSVMCSVVGALS
jgi:hypothetical protein